MVDVLLDTGPIVALLNGRDRDHERCREYLESFRGRFLTTEAILTEAVYLLGRFRGGADACLEFFVRGGAELVPQSRESLIRAKELMRQYEDVPMDFGDATLVVIAEETQLSDVFTLDQRGFSAYRPRPRSRFRIVPH